MTTVHGLVFEDAQDASLPDGENESRISHPLLFSNADTRHLDRVHASTNLRAWFDAQLLQRVLLSSLKPCVWDRSHWKGDKVTRPLW